MVALIPYIGKSIAMTMQEQDQHLLYLYFFLITFITVILYRWLGNRKTSLKNLPPSPPKLPIIGNLHQLGQDPHITLKSLAQKYGPLMLLKFGSVPVLVVSSADAAREIIKTNDLVFADRPSSSISDKLFYNGRDVGFARYSEYWRQVKSTCVTQLLSSKRVHSFQNVREEEVDLLIQNIQYSDQNIINLTDMLSELANNVVCRVSLGRKYSDKGNSYNKLLAEVTNLLGLRSIGDYIPLLCWVDLLMGLKGRVKKVTTEVDVFLEGVLKDHQNTTASNDGCGNGNFISILLDVQKQNTDNSFSIDKDCIKAVILDMFFAGTDTTSTTLEWTIASLIKTPDAMFKLQKEVRERGKGKSKISEGDLVNLHYLKAVMKESMRLNFTAPLLAPREAREDVKVMGYDIRSGTQVIINAWAIARDPTLWNNPEEFRPERFLDSPIDYKGVHYEFLPFGGGRRMCPGIQFAMAVNELALANIVHKFDFELPDGQRLEDLDMTGVTGITIRKKSPLLVIAKPHV